MNFYSFLFEHIFLVVKVLILSDGDSRISGIILKKLIFFVCFDVCNEYNKIEWLSQFNVALHVSESRKLSWNKHFLRSLLEGGSSMS